MVLFLWVRENEMAGRVIIGSLVERELSERSEG